MAPRLLLPLLLTVAAASLLVADARPCHSFFVSLPAFPYPKPNPRVVDGAVPHRVVPRVATVVTVFRVRRLGPHHRHPHLHSMPANVEIRHPHLHSIPANVQIRHPDLHSIPANVQIRRPHPAPFFTSIRAALDNRVVSDMFGIFIGVLFGVTCGALIGASLYLIWSVLAGATASSPYDQIYDDEEASDTESPKKVGYVIIQELEAQDGGKN